MRPSDAGLAGEEPAVIDPRVAGKAPRIDADAEVGVLRALLAQPARLRAVPFLRAKHFAHGNHSRIFAAMTELDAADKRISVPAVKRESGVDVDAWMRETQQGAAWHPEAYLELAEVVLRLAVIREVQDAALDAYVAGYDLDVKITDTSALQKWVNVTTERIANATAALSRPKTFSSERAAPSVPRGPEWDAIPGHEWVPGVHLLAMRSGGGKTTVAFCAAAALGWPTLAVTCEMPEDQIAARNALAGHPAELFELWQPGRPIVARDVITTVRGSPRKPKMVILDHLQHQHVMHSRDPMRDLLLMVDELNKWAEREGVVVLALSQTNQRGNEDPRSMPTRDHVYGGGTVVNAAIGLILGHIPPSEKDRPEDAGWNVRFLADKARHGKSGGKGVFATYYPKKYLVVSAGS